MSVGSEGQGNRQNCCVMFTDASRDMEEALVMNGISAFLFPPPAPPFILLPPFLQFLYVNQKTNTIRTQQLLRSLLLLGFKLRPQAEEERMVCCDCISDDCFGVFCVGC